MTVGLVNTIGAPQKTFNPPKGSIAIAPGTQCQLISSFCLDTQDRFLICDVSKNRLRVVTADDKLAQDYPLDFGPQVVACRPDGSIVVAGSGKIALLDAQGRKQLEASLPDGSTVATAVGASDKEFFVCCRVKTGYSISRFNDKLQNPTAIINGLRGCCGQMDFKVQDGKIFVAHNTQFKVETYDRTGKLLSSFGKRDDGTSRSFKGCCEPKNICFDSKGALYTSESRAWTVKKFTAKGEYVNYVGSVAENSDCVRSTIACTKDNRIYMLDNPRHFIRPILPGKSPGS
jgi:hypothetical protein